MRHLPSVLIPLAVAGSTAAAQSPAASHASSQPELKWGPAPAVFPAGAQMAVLAGNPGGQGEYTVRLTMPSGYKIAPHTHPTDENLTVISGTFKVGMGKTFDAKGMMTLATGHFATAPAEMAHYAIAVGPTVVQVHGIGPFVLTYVNPADMPKPGISTPK